VFLEWFLSLLFGFTKKGTREMTTFTTQDRQDAQRTPLTDEQIAYLARRFEGVWDGAVDYKGFARAIERAHGIGE
jgi:hypothetical protein